MGQPLPQPTGSYKYELLRKKSYSKEPKASSDFEELSRLTSDNILDEFSRKQGDDKLGKGKPLLVSIRTGKWRRVKAWSWTLVSICRWTLLAVLCLLCTSSRHGGLYCRAQMLQYVDVGSAYQTPSFFFSPRAPREICILPFSRKKGNRYQRCFEKIQQRFALRRSEKIMRMRARHGARIRTKLIARCKFQHFQEVEIPVFATLSNFRRLFAL